MEAPTCDDIWNEELEKVYSTSDPSWRHGCYMEEVYKRKDGTYWSVGYRRSTDGETNELREGLATIFQVWPKEKVQIIYEDKP